MLIGIGLSLVTIAYCITAYGFFDGFFADERRTNTETFLCSIISLLWPCIIPYKFGLSLSSKVETRK